MSVLGADAAHREKLTILPKRGRGVLVACAGTSG